MVLYYIILGFEMSNTSIYLSPEIQEWLHTNNINLSKLINEILYSIITNKPESIVKKYQKPKKFTFKCVE